MKLPKTEASKRSSMQNYKFIHLEKHLKEKRLSCHWPAFQFNSMYLVRPFPFVTNATWSKISPRQTQQGYTAGIHRCQLSSGKISCIVISVSFFILLSFLFTVEFLFAK